MLPEGIDVAHIRKRLRLLRRRGTATLHCGGAYDSALLVSRVPTA